MVAVLKLFGHTVPYCGESAASAVWKYFMTCSKRKSQKAVAGRSTVSGNCLLLLWNTLTEAKHVITLLPHSSVTFFLGNPERVTETDERYHG